MLATNKVGETKRKKNESRIQPVMTSDPALSPEGVTSVVRILIVLDLYIFLT